jgi:serpin B
MTKRIHLLICLAVIALTACGAPGAAGPQPAAQINPTALPTAEPAPTAEPTPEAIGKPIAKGEVTPELVAANTRFGLNLFRELLKADGGKNVFISPASVAIALAMTYNGARGDTAAAMAATLEVTGMSLEEVNLAYAALKQALETADPSVQLAIANSLWARQEVDFLDDFMQRVELYYGAEVSALDFNTPDAANTINDWVRRNTQGKIDGIVDQVPPEAILYLINAIYFKGGWVTPFDPKLTQEMPFNLAGGGQKPVQMMAQSGNFRYLRGDGFQAVILPYGKADSPQPFHMAVFLPEEGRTLADFYQSMTPESWEQWVAAFGPAEGDLGLPRFKLEYDVTLNDALQALGMAAAFDPGQADFSGMAPVPPEIFINRARHKTFVEVNEEGTEAAAVTSIEMGATMAQPAEERFSMIVDRPFFVAIRDGQTGAVLFMGSIVEP